MTKKTLSQKLDARENKKSEIGSSRRFLFLAIITLTPFILLLLLEFSLRLGNYGGELRLVVEREVGQRRFYSINRHVAKRYFTKTGATIPEPHDETFELAKQSNTKRIFCIGESTMEGFPYEFHATAPAFLRDRLRAQFPQYNVEVINVGLSAVSSYVVLDFMRELMQYQPDLFIVYVGHNEFYGAYGVGSTLTAGGDWMTRLTLYLLKFKTFLMLRDAYLKVTSLFATPSNESVGTMMQQLAAEKEISFGSTTYLQAQEIYRKNIERLIEAAQSTNTPIMISALVSNWKDQPPFVNGELHADSIFRVGKTNYEQGKFHEARASFVRAKDYDVLRFRATEDFQTLLVSICQKNGVPIARTDSTFFAHSPHDIPGNELFLEHLHPNIEGYFLMAKTFANTMGEHNLVFQKSDWENAPSVSDSQLMEVSTVSEFDRVVGKLKTDFLKRRWPFNKGAVNFEFKAENPVESLVFKYLQKEVGWSDARYMLADYYAKNMQFDLARRECRAVAKALPFYYEPFLRIADYYRVEGKRDDAIKAYMYCLSVEENPYAHVKLAIISLDNADAATAAMQLESAFRANEKFYEPFSAEAASAARYLLGLSYANTKRLQEAKAQLNHSLAINPNNQHAKDLLRQLP